MCGAPAASKQMSEWPAAPQAQPNLRSAATRRRYEMMMVVVPNAIDNRSISWIRQAYPISAKADQPTPVVWRRTDKSRRGVGVVMRKCRLHVTFSVGWQLVSNPMQQVVCAERVDRPPCHRIFG